MIPSSLAFILCFTALGLPLAARLRTFAPLERLAAAAGGVMVVLYLASFFVYLTGVSWSWLWLLPWAGIAWLWIDRSRLTPLLENKDVRSVLAGWLFIALWCLGLQILIFSYSGAGWSLDWYEHYDRACFFIHRWPLDHIFIARNSLPARPPLANLVVAGLLGLSGDNFSNYQVVMTLLGSLVVFPLAALTRLQGANGRTLHLLVLLLMLNPMLVQNATFPWTKLAAALFVLLAVMFLMRAARGLPGIGLALVALAAGLLAHYSVAPWIIALGAGVLFWLRSSPIPPGWQRELWLGGLAAGVLMATWFVWAGVEFGPTAVASATSTVALAPHATLLAQAGIALGNIRNTLAPDWGSHFFAYLMHQSEFVGRLRDMMFCLYQLNFFVAFGLGSLGVLVWRVAHEPAGPARRFWLAVVPLLLVIGCAVVTVPDGLGLAHICLLPLVLLGLAWAACSTPPRWLAILWATGLAFDAVLGIGFHFGVQSLFLLRWLHPGLSDRELIDRLNPIAISSYGDKLWTKQPFLYDLTAGWHEVVVALLALLLAMAVFRWSAAGHRKSQE